jgi:asparagine synthetase B (glutamine-hydrolysing)
MILMHLREQKLYYFRRLRHRGPDWSGIHCHQDCYLAHQRLAIIDPTSGDQPLFNEDKTVVVTVCIQIWHNETSILLYIYLCCLELISTY